MKPAWLIAAFVLLGTTLAWAQTPTPGATDSPPEDSAEPSAAVAAGTVAVQVRDAEDRPVPGLEVRLMQGLFGHDEEAGKLVRSGPTDAQGKLVLTGLAGGRGVAYEVQVASGGATFTSGPFDLSNDRGQAVLLHVYPATSDLEQTQVGMQVVAYAVPRDDMFQWEVLLTVFNLGRVAWVTRDTRLVLPRDARGIESETRAAGLGWVPEDGSARLVGTAPPGRHEVALRFQVKSQHEDAASFHFELPPRVMEAQVVAEGPSSLKLEVADAPPAELRSGPKGQRLWVVGRQASAASPPLRELAVTLTGLPTPGQGRWITLAAALFLAAWGVWPARGKKHAGRSLSDADARQAHQVVLDELILLERARRDELVGAGTYEATRGKLLRALSELGYATDKPGVSSRRSKRWRQAGSRPGRKR